MIKEERTCMECGCLLPTMREHHPPRHVCVVHILKKMVKEDPHLQDENFANVLWQFITKVTEEKE